MGRGWHCADRAHWLRGCLVSTTNERDEARQEAAGANAAHGDLESRVTDLERSLADAEGRVTSAEGRAASAESEAKTTAEAAAEEKYKTRKAELDKRTSELGAKEKPSRIARLPSRLPRGDSTCRSFSSGTYQIGLIFSPAPTAQTASPIANSRFTLSPAECPDT